MNKLSKILPYVLVALLSVALTLAVVVNFIPTKTAPSGTPTGTYSKLDQLLDYIDTYFIEDIDRTALEDAAAEAMVEAMGDRWSFYMSADYYGSWQETTNNAYVGIGVTIQLPEGENLIEIVDVASGGPAEAAGVQVHDRIAAVDGTDCRGLTMDEVKTLVKGEEGTQVVLTVQRGNERLDLMVDRATVDVPVAVGQMLPSGYGLIQIVNFDSKCADETIAAIEELVAQGAKGLIFDVRFNPGGYASELVKVLDRLLPEGELFRTVDYLGRESVDTSDATYLDLPMAVLVNEDSYSAAEFFAAALQEYEAAVIVGTKTCGKGYFQWTFELLDGSAANISAGKYFTPKGVSLAGVGVTPDCVVEVDEEIYAQIYYGELDSDEDPQIQAAISALNGN